MAQHVEASNTITRYALPVAGELYDGGETLVVLDKFTGKPWAEVAVADREAVDRAIRAAEKAYKEMALTPYRRYEVLLRASQLLQERKEQIAEVMVHEGGKVWKEALGEVDRATQTLILSGEEAKRVTGEMIPVEGAPGAENRLGFTIRVPIGVICAIGPFNFPLNLVAHKVAPAIAAGNGVVLKPASTTPVTSLMLAEVLYDAGLPREFLSVVVGSGSTVGEWLLQDERFGHYTFTGSAKVGERIKEVTKLRHCTLELGSNAATIVHEDADLDKAANLCAIKAFNNAGQVCISVQRLLVHETVFDDFLQRLVAETDRLVLGDPRDPNTDIGPMISESEAERVENWVQEALQQGARLVRGGKRNGSMFEPTILTDVRRDMKVVCEEVFGPVVTVVPYRNIDEALEIANDSRFGLQGGLFTRSLEIMYKVAREFRVGGLMVNDASSFRVDQMPYGGVKNSGIGREGPRYAIEDMTELHLVVVNL